MSEVVRVYNESLAFAQNVGHIDWPSPFPVKILEELIGSNELDCLEDNQRLELFYTNTGFRVMGNVSFFSTMQNEILTVKKFEVKYTLRDNQDLNKFIATSQFPVR